MIFVTLTLQNALCLASMTESSASQESAKQEMQTNSTGDQNENEETGSDGHETKQPEQNENENETVNETDDSGEDKSKESEIENEAKETSDEAKTEVNESTTEVESKPEVELNPELPKEESNEKQQNDKKAARTRPLDSAQLGRYVWERVTKSYKETAQNLNDFLKNKLEYVESIRL